jgi:predicted DCC family thiol-disulfide oxidoreductase YuxK
MPDGARLLLIYDGRCGVCTRLVDWVRARDARRRVAIVPNQRPGLLERARLTRAQVDASAWAIDRAGRRYEGAAAINRTLEELGSGWRRLARLYRLPLMRTAEDAGYRWFAANRGRFGRWGSTPGCHRPGADCLPADEGGAGDRRGCCGGARLH